MCWEVNQRLAVSRRNNATATEDRRGACVSLIYIIYIYIYCSKIIKHNSNFMPEPFENIFIVFTKEHFHHFGLMSVCLASALLEFQVAVGSCVK